jgi:hypothetical protein
MCFYDAEFAGARGLGGYMRALAAESRRNLARLACGGVQAVTPLSVPGRQPPGRQGNAGPTAAGASGGSGIGTRGAAVRQQPRALPQAGPGRRHPTAQRKLGNRNARP